MLALQRKLRNDLIMLIIIGVIIIAYLFIQSERMATVERLHLVNKSEIFILDEALKNEIGGKFTSENNTAKSEIVNGTKETYDTGNWQKVNEYDNVYVYSAYIDWPGGSEALVIAAEKPEAEQGETIIGQKTEESSLYCAYWYLGHLSNNLVKAEKVASPLVERKKGRSVMYRCQLSDSSAISPPEAVSLVQLHKDITPRNYLPLNIETNQNEGITFAVCIPPQLHSIDKEMMLIELIELNRILGAEYFVFYRYLLKSTAFDNVLRAYSDKGMVQIVDWTHINILPFELDQYGRIGAINDCYRRMRFKSTYIVILDLNEFLIPKNPEIFTWIDMMQQIPSIRKGAFVFHIAYFRTDWPDASPSDNVTNVANAQNYGLQTLLKLHREDKVSPPGMATRYIVHSHRVKILGESSVSVMNPDYSSTLVQPSIGLVHRYVFGTVFDSEKLYDGSVPAKYGDKLVDRVREAWKDLSG